MTDAPEPEPAPEVDEKGIEIRIVVGGDGKMAVGWKGIPDDKTILYGIIETARDIIRRKFERDAESGAPRIIPAASMGFRRNGRTY